MSGRANTESVDDAWGGQDQNQPGIIRKDASGSLKKNSAPVRDAWDDEENDVEPEEPDAKELWEKANISAPLPQIQLSTTSSSSSVPLPPVAALQGPLRILKRPSAASSTTSPLPSNSQSQISFREREAKYQAARARIFGDDRSPETSRSPSPKSTIIRDPVGPTSGNKEGFGARKKKATGASTSLPAAENSIGAGDGSQNDTTS